METVGNKGVNESITMLFKWVKENCVGENPKTVCISRMLTKISLSCKLTTVRGNVKIIIFFGFLHYLIIKRNIKEVFEYSMIPGHTKFKVDSFFVKRKIRKQKICHPQQAIDICNSTKGWNALLVWPIND